MALAQYFERNAQAAAALIKGFDAGLLGTKLEQEVIGLAFDTSVESSKEGQAAVDLALRLVARLYPRLVIVGAPGTKSTYLKRLHQLARSINPLIDISQDVHDATRLLVMGTSKFPLNKKAKTHTWYVGSDNWFAKLSMSKPVGSGTSNNPFGAGAAACIAVANVFRAVFAKELSEPALDVALSTSLLDLRPTTASSHNPPLASVRLDDVHLVGAGAIGNGALWALSRMPCLGTLHVVDHEKISDSNLQRYVMLVASDRMKDKAALAKEWFTPSKNRLNIVPHVKDWASHIASIKEHKAGTVLSAVDSAEARIQIQASLPKVIFNGWTQRGEAGVSRHWFLGERACLACLYIPTGIAPSEDLLVAKALRLGEDEPTVREVRRRLQLSVPTERAFLEQIAATAGISVDKVTLFENRPLRDLYVEGVCGGGVMEFHQAALQAKAEVPMGFQSALAGILLAAELARPEPLEHTVTQIDLLGSFPERPGTPRTKTLTPRCLCLDKDFIEIFKQKYAST